MPQPKRNWRPFHETRAHVRSLRLENQKAYESWSKSGKRPDDIPGSPSKAYVNEWEGWADFLGNNGSRPHRVCAARQYLLFAEAREYVRKLGLQTQKEYAAWAKTTHRPVGIPAGPYSIYGDQWTNWSDWLGTRGADGYRPFEEAKAYVHAQHFNTRQEWLDHTASPDFPMDLPIYPEYGYRDSGWVDWPDWLGVAGKLTRPRILAILNAIAEVVPDLRPAELYAILCHKGVMTTDRRHTHIEALRALEELCNSGNVEATLTKALTALDSSRSGNIGPLDAGDAAAISDLERELTSEEIERASPIPKLRSLESLRVVDKAVSLGLVGDSDLIDFLFSSRLAALWQEVFDGNPEFSPEQLQAAATGQYFDVIRDRFLTEYHGALNLQLPEGYGRTCVAVTAPRPSPRCRPSGEGCDDLVGDVLANLVLGRHLSASD